MNCTAGGGELGGGELTAGGGGDAAGGGGEAAGGGGDAAGGGGLAVCTRRDDEGIQIPSLKTRCRVFILNIAQTFKSL